MEYRYPPLQLYNMATRKISGHPPTISAGDQEDVTGNLRSALPSFTFGAPDLVNTANNDILPTYYSVAHDTEKLQA